MMSLAREEEKKRTESNQAKLELGGEKAGI